MNWDNIYYELGEISYDDLCESKYLSKILYYIKESLGDKFDRYDFYIYSSNGIYNLPKPIVICNSKPKVLIYISDEQATVPIYLNKYFIAIFKCYLAESHDEEKIYPFPLGYHKDVPELQVIPIAERTTNVFFSGDLEHENRLAFYKELSPLRFFPDRVFYGMKNKIKKYFPRDCSTIFNNSIINFTSGFSSGLSGDEYAKILYNSKIVLCPPGHSSVETFRHFEAMRAGCVVITQRLSNTILYKDAPFIIVDNWGELRSIINNLLRDPEKMKNIHNNTLNWWNDVCSEKAMADYILKQLERCHC